MFRTDLAHASNLCGVPGVVLLMTRATFNSVVLLIRILAAAASRPRPAPPSTAWTIYGDVIIEVVSPKDPASGGTALRLRAA